MMMLNVLLKGSPHFLLKSKTHLPSTLRFFTTPLKASTNDLNLPPLGDLTSIPPVKPLVQDIYEENFKNRLKDFCHNYQIPFLENNIPKSCRQAAKIYYRLCEDNQEHSIPERYKGVV